MNSIMFSSIIVVFVKEGDRRGLQFADSNMIKTRENADLYKTGQFFQSADTFCYDRLFFKSRQILSWHHVPTYSPPNFRLLNKVPGY